MQDVLLQVSRNPQARKFVKMLGLPIPMPQSLARGRGAWTERPLFDRDVVLYTSPGSALTMALAQVVVESGAIPHVVGNEEALRAFKGPGEAFGRMPRELSLEDLPPLRPHALVFDATTAKTSKDLRALYSFFHPIVRGLDRCGRIVVLGRPPAEQAEPRVAATQAALEGFARSLAKEVGRKGSTAHVVFVSEGAEDRIAGPLRFLLSARSAYVSGQPFAVDSVVKVEEEESTPWTFSLEGKVALVTGAARGIGAATARRLAEEGAQVVCLDRPQDDGPTSQLAREINGKVLLVDVTAENAPEEICRWLSENCGGVDIVVHNAGVTRDKTLARMKPDAWDMAIDVNLEAVVRMTEALLEGTLRDQGRVVCLSSVSGIAGNMGQTNYAASKSGVVGLVRSLARQVAARGITVNAIAPGFIETRLTAAMPTVIREVARRMNNLSQGGQPIDVAEAVAFLSMPHSCGVTGQTIRVCGGALIGA